MPINASPHFEKAQAEYERAEGTEQKIRLLKKMITLAPKHKGSENLLKQLRTRLKKLKYTKEKESKKVGSTQKGIKKEDMQAVIVGFTNSGKSSLLSLLTNAEPKISENKFSTTQPIVGMMSYASTSIQLVEIPAIESEHYNKGVVHTADTILILVNNIEEIEKIKSNLGKANGKQIIVFNNKDNLDERKITATLQSKKYNFVLIDLGRESRFDNSTFHRVGGQFITTIGVEGGLSNLHEKLFQSFGKIRIYTKEPGKEKSPRPIIMKPNTTVKDVAEKILKGFSKNVKDTKIWGPSSKFPGQKIGLKHELKDLDVVEFKTK